MIKMASYNESLLLLWQKNKQTNKKKQNKLRWFYSIFRMAKQNPPISLHA